MNRRFRKRHMKGLSAIDLLDSISKTFIDQSVQFPVEAKDEINAYIIDMAKTTLKLEKIQHLILNTVGYSSDYHRAETVHAEFLRVTHWIEDIFCEAMVDRDHFCDLFEKGTLRYQVEIRTNKEKNTARG